MTTLVHIGDTHVRPGPRAGDVYAALDQILVEGLELARVGRLGAWLWPGDLSHARQAISDRNALIDRIVTMANAAPVVIVRGNHDAPGDLYGFAKIRATYPVIVIEEAPEVVRFRTATGVNVSAACLPYPDKGGLTALGVGPSAVADVAGDVLEPIVVKLAADLALASAAGDCPIFLAHINVAGSVASVGQPNVGREVELGSRHLDRFGAIYKGANHIHKAQQIAGLHYAGSICRLDWGEVEPKGYLTIDVARDGLAIDPASGWAYAVDWHELPVPPMYHVEGELTRDGFAWRVTAGPGGAPQPPPASWQGCEVRVRYRFNASERSVIDEARALADFAEALRLEPDPIAIPDRALRAPEVVEARTLADKLAAWAKVAGVVPGAGVLHKLAALEHVEPAELVTQTQARLAALEARPAETVPAS